MSEEEEDPTSCFLKEMALQLVQQFSPKELQIIWTGFKLHHRKVSKIIKDTKNVQDLGFQSQSQWMMNINYPNFSNKHKSRKQNIVFSKNKLKRNPLGVTQISVQNKIQVSKMKSDKVMKKQVQNSLKTCISNNPTKTKRFSQTIWKQNILPYQSSLKQFLSKKHKKTCSQLNNYHRTSHIINYKDSSVPKLLIQKLTPNISAFQSACQTSSRFKSHKL